MGRRRIRNISLVATSLLLINLLPAHGDSLFARLLGKKSPKDNEIYLLFVRIPPSTTRTLVQVNHDLNVICRTYRKFRNTLPTNVNLISHAKLNMIPSFDRPIVIIGFNDKSEPHYNHTCSMVLTPQLAFVGSSMSNGAVNASNERIDMPILNGKTLHFRALETNVGQTSGDAQTSDEKQSTALTPDVISNDRPNEQETAFVVIERTGDPSVMMVNQVTHHIEKACDAIKNDLPSDLTGKHPSDLNKFIISFNDNGLRPPECENVAFDDLTTLRAEKLHWQLGTGH